MDCHGGVEIEWILMVGMKLECIIIEGVELEWIVMVGVDLE